ncbi:MAG: ATP-binding protein [Nanoarchaeota archaeon]|nr:ATP-binding protein [Nanoarchaeota archaeon]
MPYDIIIGRDETDKKRFGKKGLIYLGKGYVKMGQYTSLSNPIFMDIARSHVILIAGKRGSGKSYTLGSIAEELTTLTGEEKKNIAPLIFDTMGIFWTMKYKNEKDRFLLSDWGLKPRELPVQTFVPFGHYDKYIENQIPVDKKFSIKAKDMKPEDWILTFNLSMTEPTAVAIERAVNRLSKLRKDFDVDVIKEEINKDSTTSQNTKNSAVGLFEAAEGWGIFANKGEKGTDVDELTTAGKTNILDLSVYNAVGAFNVRALVIGLVSRKIFEQRMLARKKEEIQTLHHGLNYLSFDLKREKPLVWIFIDEIHEFIPQDYKTPASDALTQLLREGRQPGISMVMATQQPGVLSYDAITQSDIVIAHRLTAMKDIVALENMMQSYLLKDIKRYLDELPNLKGSAILLDDNSERIYPMRARPRFTWHGGEAPIAIKVEKEKLEVENEEEI